MSEGMNNKKKIQVKSFNYKWYQFLITYGILNIFFFLSINTIINSIYENFSKLYVSGVRIDGTDFSIFANLLATPIFVFLMIITIIIGILQEFIITLLFRFVYFMSVVKDEEKVRLHQYIKITLLCFLLLNIIGIIFLGDIYRTILFVFLYLPIPFFITHHLTKCCRLP